MPTPDIRREPFRLLIPGGAKARWLYGEDIGPEASQQVFICLPGLLETRKSFNPFVETLGRDYRIFVLDWPGRGESDMLEDSSLYRMSRYLHDFGVIYAHIQGRLRAGDRRGLSFGIFGSPKQPAVHLVGTSMGGLLAMFFARYQSSQLSSIVLNDVGCLLPWSGILGLMTGIRGATKATPMFGQTQDLARELEVDPRLLRAVQAPGHLDLPHETTIHGVDFGEVFREVTLPILVLKGEESEIVNDIAASHLTRCHPNTSIVTVPEAGHPVPYSQSVCQSVLAFCLQQAQRPVPMDPAPRGA